jgi:hypothetical protein
MGYWLVCGFIDHLCTPIGATGSTALSLIYTLYGSQSSLVLSWQRISTQYLHQSHCNCSTHEVFFVQPNSFLAFSSQSSPTATSRGSVNSISHSSEILVIWPRGGPHRKHTVAWIRLFGNVFIELFHSNGCTHLVLWQFPHCYVGVLPSNGYFSGSTILSLSKYATICLKIRLFLRLLREIFQYD